MKKKKLIEKRRALKEAYYNELKKMGVIKSEKTLEEYTVKELKEMSLNEGLELDKKLTKKADIINAINVYREEKKALEQEKQALLEVLKEKQELTEENFNMTNEELKELIETLEEYESDQDNNEEGAPEEQGVEE